MTSRLFKPPRSINGNVVVVVPWQHFPLAVPRIDTPPTTQYVLTRCDQAESIGHIFSKPQLANSLSIHLSKNIDSSLIHLFSPNSQLSNSLITDSTRLIGPSNSGKSELTKSIITQFWPDAKIQHPNYSISRHLQTHPHKPHDRIWELPMGRIIDSSGFDSPISSILSRKGKQFYINSLNNEPIGIVKNLVLNVKNYNPINVEYLDHLTYKIKTGISIGKLIYLKPFIVNNPYSDLTCEVNIKLSGDLPSRHCMSIKKLSSNESHLEMFTQNPFVNKMNWKKSYLTYIDNFTLMVNGMGQVNVNAEWGGTIGWEIWTPNVDVAVQVGDKFGLLQENLQSRESVMKRLVS